MKSFGTSLPLRGLLPLLLLSGMLSGYGQPVSSSGDFWSRVRYGGGLGLAFGSNSVQVGVAPSAVYQANAYVAVGLGLNYIYAKYDVSRLSAFGGSVIGLVNPIPAIQLSAEFEQLRVRRTLEASPSDIRDTFWLPALYAGIGYSTGPVTFGIRYDLLYNTDRSLYADPWLPFVRVYF